MRGSLELDNQRFPSYRGTPVERLAKLNRDVRAHGWRSVGLWVHSGRAAARMDPKVNEEQYWAQRMLWCRDAGIDYWKVDWGAMGGKDVWRLNQWAQRTYPGLWIEHGGGAKPTGERVWLADKIGVWRTYDVNPSAAVYETIRRVACALRYPREDRRAAGLINCEDEPYIGAGLGCVYGVPLPGGEAQRGSLQACRTGAHGRTHCRSTSCAPVRTIAPASTAMPWTAPKRYTPPGRYRLARSSRSTCRPTEGT
jgi:hypothetical protein